MGNSLKSSAHACLFLLRQRPIMANELLYARNQHNSGAIWQYARVKTRRSQWNEGNYNLTALVNTKLPSVVNTRERISMGFVMGSQWIYWDQIREPENQRERERKNMTITHDNCMEMGSRWGQKDQLYLHIKLLYTLTLLLYNQSVKSQLPPWFTSQSNQPVSHVNSLSFQAK